MSAQIYNLEAEISCLSSIIYDDKNYDIVFSKIIAEDFYDSKNRVIAKSIQDYKKINGDKVLDFISFTDFLRKNNDLEKSGGVSYITKLLDNYASSSNLETYAAIIAEKSLFRNLKKINSDFNVELSSPAKNTFTKDILEKLQNQLYHLEKKQYGEYSSINDLIFDSVGELQKITKEQLASSKLGIDYICRGVPTGFNQLDKIISGLQKTHLVIIGGRTGMGKTLFMTSMAQNIGISSEGEKKSVGIFSLEMSAEELTNRILFSQAQVSYRSFLEGGALEGNKNHDSKMWDKITNAASILKDKNKAGIFIDDTSRTIQEIDATARRMVRENEVEVIFIDYIQFITPDKNQMRMPREQQIATFSNELKQMAKRLKVPIVCLAQLNREVEKKGTNDRKPQLANLRDSGSLEQDADIVMFVYRESYYNDKNLSTENEAQSKSEIEKNTNQNVSDNVELNEKGKQELEENNFQMKERERVMENVFEILVRKNRHGQTGNVYLKNNLSQFRITDIPKEELEVIDKLNKK